MIFQATAVLSARNVSQMWQLLSAIGLSGLKSGNRLLKLCSDHGGEYISSDLRNFLSENGVEHQMTVPHTPQQNCRAERFNCMLLEKSEAMRQHACLPPFFWQDAVETSLHIYVQQTTNMLS